MPGRFGLTPHVPPAATMPQWRRAGLAGPSTPSISCPALIVGGIVGWFIIRPVNAVLGWFFRGFNRWFDRMTDVYGRAVGRCCA